VLALVALVVLLALVSRMGSSGRRSPPAGDQAGLRRAVELDRVAVCLRQTSQLARQVEARYREAGSDCAKIARALPDIASARRERCRGLATASDRGGLGLEPVYEAMEAYLATHEALSTLIHEARREAAGKPAGCAVQPRLTAAFEALRRSQATVQQQLASGLGPALTK